MKNLFIRENNTNISLDFTSGIFLKSYHQKFPFALISNSNLVLRHKYADTRPTLRLRTPPPNELKVCHAGVYRFEAKFP